MSMDVSFSSVAPFLWRFAEQTLGGFEQLLKRAALTGGERTTDGQFNGWGEGDVLPMGALPEAAGG